MRLDTIVKKMTDDRALIATCERILALSTSRELYDVRAAAKDAIRLATARIERNEKIYMERAPKFTVGQQVRYLRSSESICKGEAGTVQEVLWNGRNYSVTFEGHWPIVVQPHNIEAVKA